MTIEPKRVILHGLLDIVICEPVIDENVFAPPNGVTPQSSPKIISSSGKSKYGDSAELAFSEFIKTGTDESVKVVPLFVSDPTFLNDLGSKFGSNASIETKEKFENGSVKMKVFTF
jgi:hypothetical protein